MRITKVIPLAVALIVGGGAARAEEDPAMAAFSKKLDTYVRGSHKPADFVVVYQIPGEPLDPYDATDANSKMAINLIVDRCYKTNAKDQAEPNEDKTVSGTFDKIYNNHKLINAEEKQPDAETAAAQTLVDPNGDAWKNYAAAKAALDVAKEARDQDRADRITAKKTGTTPSVQQAYDDAVAKFAAADPGGKIKRALDLVNTYNHSDPHAYWTTLTGRFNAAGDPDTKSWPVITFPNPTQWTTPPTADAPGSWMEFSYEKSSSSTSSESHSMGVTVSLKVDRPAVQVEGGGSYSQSLTKSMSESKNLVIKMKLMRVILNRPWAETDVLHNKLWKFDPSSTFANTVVSDGKGGGDMPWLPTQIIVASDIHIGFDMSQQTAEAMEKDIQAHLSVSVAGITVGGSFSKNDKSAKANSTATKAGIDSHGCQIVAICGVPLGKDRIPFLK